jgi:predicted Zn-dependent peptidase
MNRQVSLICQLVAGVCCFAQTPAKQAPPEGGPPKPFTLPASQVWTLKNGLGVTMTPYGVIPKVTIEIAVRAGNINEQANQVWLADMTGEMLNEGTATRSSEEVAREAARMGGRISINVGPDVTLITGDALSDYAQDLVTLMADVVQHPALPDSQLNRIRANMLRRLAIERSNPGAQANEAFARAIYGDHPYGRVFPTEEMLRSYTIDDVRRFYKSNFGAARSHIYIAGRFDPSVKQAIQKEFENWERGSAIEEHVPKNAPAKITEIVDRPGAAQSTIRLGLRVAPPTSPDYIPLQVTNSLLGGAFASRITTNIREQKGYTYSPFSRIQTHYHDAVWAEEADITTAVTGPALKEIMAEIARLRREAPGQQELQGIKNYMSGVFVIRNSSPAGVIAQLRFVDLQGLGENWLRDYVPNVLKVSPQQIQAMTEKYLDPDKMALVVVGDRSKIDAQIKEIRPAE